MDRTPQRRERLRRRLKADRVDGLLVVSESNVRYLTGFTGDSSALLVTRDRAIVVSDGRYVTQLEQECPELEVEIRPIGQPLVQAIAEAGREARPARLGFEAAALSAADFLTLKEKLTTVELRAVTGRVEALRAIKDRERDRRDPRGDRHRRARVRDAPGRPAAGRDREGRRRRAGRLPAALRRDRGELSADRRRRASASALPHARPTARRADRRRPISCWSTGGRPAGPTKVT